MNNNAAIGVVVAVVVLGAIAYFMWGGTPSMPGDEQNQQAGNEQVSATSLQDLITSGRSQQCSFADTESGNDVSGTVYAASGKVRVDFSGTSDGKTMSGHTITDGTTSSTWIDGMATGFTMTTTAQSSAGAAQQGFDATKPLNYRCSSWSADSSKFALPSGVAFTDMSAVVP